MARITARFPGANIALDTAGLKAVTSGNKDFVRRKMAARFAWACEDPREIEQWNVGLRLVESRSPMEVSGPLRSRLSWALRATFRLLSGLFPKISRVYRLNLFAS